MNPLQAKKVDIKVSRALPFFCLPFLFALPGTAPRQRWMLYDARQALSSLLHAPNEGHAQLTGSPAVAHARGAAALPAVWQAAQPQRPLRQAPQGAQVL